MKYVGVDLHKQVISVCVVIQEDNKRKVLHLQLLIQNQFDDVPEGFCTIADLPGECVSVPEACPEIFDPVCGCDGKTYGNDCERIRAGVQKDHDGPCRKR